VLLGLVVLEGRNGIIKANTMAKSLIFELPKIVEEGRKEAQRILERIGKWYEYWIADKRSRFAEQRCFWTLERADR
jgi:hypothetical protein